MDEHVYLLTIFLPLATILLVFGMKYVSAAIQARVSAADQQRYVALADSIRSQQQDCIVVLDQIRIDVASLSARAARIEAILNQVG